MSNFNNSNYKCRDCVYIIVFMDKSIIKKKINHSACSKGTVWVKSIKQSSKICKYFKLKDKDND